MEITIIGTGNMARGIGTRALVGGNNVILLGHTPAKARELAAELQATAQGGAVVRAADDGASLEDEVVVLAVPYAAVASITQHYGAQFAGKIVVDITNPVNFETFDEWWEPFTLGVGPAGGYLARLDPTRQSQLRDLCTKMLPAAPFIVTARAWAAQGVA